MHTAALLSNHRSQDTFSKVIECSCQICENFAADNFSVFFPVSFDSLYPSRMYGEPKKVLRTGLFFVAHQFS